MPNPIQSAAFFQSGLINHNDEQKSIVMVGGTNCKSTIVFDSKTRSWSKKADLPFVIYGGATLPYKDSFIIIGGYQYKNSAGLEKSILYYNPLLDKWEVLEEEMRSARVYFTAFYVPNDYC